MAKQMVIKLCSQKICPPELEKSLSSLQMESGEEGGPAHICKIRGSRISWIGRSLDRNAGAGIIPNILIK